MPCLICFFVVQSSSRKSAQFLPRISQDKAVEAKLDTVPKKVDVAVSTESKGAEGLEREELRKILKDELRKILKDEWRQPIEDLKKRLMKIEAQLTKNQTAFNQKMSAVEAVLSDVKNGVIEVEQGTWQVVSYFLESRYSANA